MRLEEGHQGGILKTTGVGGEGLQTLIYIGGAVREAACRLNDGLLEQEQCSVVTCK